MRDESRASAEIDGSCPLHPLAPVSPPYRIGVEVVGQGDVDGVAGFEAQGGTHRHDVRLVPRGDAGGEVSASLLFFGGPFVGFVGERVTRATREERRERLAGGGK